MNKQLKRSKIMVGITSLALSAGVFAGTSGDWMMDPVGDFIDGTTEMMNTSAHDWDNHWDRHDWRMRDMYEPDYMVVDKDTHHVTYLDGVDKGTEVSSEGNLPYRDGCRKGDMITDLHTKRTGIITGVKRHGTMDVMKHNGKNVRYQYVIYKVKPVK